MNANIRLRRATILFVFLSGLLLSCRSDKPGPDSQPTNPPVTEIATGAGMTPIASETPAGETAVSPTGVTPIAIETPADETAVSPVAEPATAASRTISILLDDFTPLLNQGGGFYPYNRMGGNRGLVNDSQVEWGYGQITTTITLDNSWGGMWMSLNHPIEEAQTINFSAVLPPQILPAYQSRITGITARIVDGTTGAKFKLELKDRVGQLQWQKETVLEGGEQIVSASLPALDSIKEFLWVLDSTSAGDYVVLDSISFTGTTQITDTATAAFVWSYGMLLNNWNPESGLVRDKGRHAGGEFDAIQATSSLAAATAIAAQLEIIEPDSARQIVEKIGEALLVDMPRFQGLWPHFVNVSATGAITIAPGTEWSSVDTAIAAVALLNAQGSLGMETAGTEEMIRSIAWDEMVSDGGISHGYQYNGEPIPYAWDVFGGESWLVELAYAGAGSQVMPLAYPSAPTANGAGFIDELAWLYVQPPAGVDYWGNDWEAYRNEAADLQVQYYPTHYPGHCFDRLGLFGLSAAEIPTPWTVGNSYQAFGVGGRFSDANDGVVLLGAPVVTPHYAPMIASLRPQEAIAMWNWLINETPFSPLNNVESFMFPDQSECKPENIEWNHLKGSWNLALQTLGWGNYLLQRNGETPSTWQNTIQNPFLNNGYELLVPDHSN